MPTKERLKFKNQEEAHVWSRFACAVVESCESDDPQELVSESAELADRFIVEEYRKRWRQE